MNSWPRGEGFVPWVLTRTQQLPCFWSWATGCCQQPALLLGAVLGCWGVWVCLQHFNSSMFVQGVILAPRYLDVVMWQGVVSLHDACAVLNDVLRHGGWVGVGVDAQG